MILLRKGQNSNDFTDHASSLQKHLIGSYFVWLVIKSNINCEDKAGLENAICNGYLSYFFMLDSFMLNISSKIICGITTHVSVIITETCALFFAHRGYVFITDTVIPDILPK